MTAHSRTGAFAAILATAALPALADEALVAVAANFAGAVEAISTAFTEETGHTLVITTGSTGLLYAQITEGAPFDVMLSADAATPARLGDEGKGDADSIFTYAIGKLALYSRDEDRVGDDPAAALTDPSALFIAIANPDLAPYGISARETIESLGLTSDIANKVVMGQNIGQAFALTDSGAAQLGFVAASALIGPGIEPRGSFYIVPQDHFTPIRQDAILLDADNAAAVAFLDFLQGDTALGIIEDFGYATE